MTDVVVDPATTKSGGHASSWKALVIQPVAILVVLAAFAILLTGGVGLVGLRALRD